jgi:phosphate transport system substrate-binding protein
MNIGSNRALIGIVAILILTGGVAVTYIALDSGGGGGPVHSYFDFKGSDTMLEVGTYWAEGYHEETPTTTINVSGGGSGVGIAALIDGEVDLAQASRQMKVSEIEEAEAAGEDPVKFPMAIDGIAVIVNQNNPLTEISIQDLRGIFNGTITNWEDLGGADLEIDPMGRMNVSGTYVFFQEHVLDGEDYTERMMNLGGNQAIVNAVVGDVGAIGYVGIGYVSVATGIDILGLKETSSSPAYLPTDEEAVMNGSYYLARYLYFYTDGVPTGELREYILWVLEPTKGQQIAQEVGFYALPQEVIDENKEILGAL